MKGPEKGIKSVFIFKFFVQFINDNSRKMTLESNAFFCLLIRFNFVYYTH